MKIIIREEQLKTIILEQNKIIGFAKDLYNKYFGDKEETKPKTETKPVEIPFTPKNFGNYVKQIGIVHPDVAIAQAMIESAHFNSNVFKTNNNLFGMKFPRQRKTTSIGEKNGHANYKNWQDSVLDYKLWQDARQVTNLTKEKYIEKLDKIYCIPPECSSNKYSKLVSSLLSRASSLLN